MIPDTRHLRHCTGGVGSVVLCLYHALDPCPQAGGMPSWMLVVDGACWVPWGGRPPHQTRTFLYDPGSSAARMGCPGVHSLRWDAKGYLLSREETDDTRLTCVRFLAALFVGVHVQTQQRPG